MQLNEIKSIEMRVKAHKKHRNTQKRWSQDVILSGMTGMNSQTWGKYAKRPIKRILHEVV